MITFKSVQCHPGLTYILNFWHLGTLALRAECQSAQMSEIITVGYTWMAKCNQLTSLSFKGFNCPACCCVLGINMRVSEQCFIRSIVCCAWLMAVICNHRNEFLNFCCDYHWQVRPSAKRVENDIDLLSASSISIYPYPLLHQFGVVHVVLTGNVCWMCVSNYCDLITDGHVFVRYGLLRMGILPCWVIYFKCFNLKLVVLYTCRYLHYSILA